MRFLCRSLTVLTLATLGCSTALYSATGQTPLSAMHRKQDITCLSNEKQIALGMLMYAQDHNQTFPDLKSSAQVTNSLMPYIRNKALFLCPDTRTGYQYNPKLSGSALRSIPLPASTPIICDTKAHADGTWVVAYADGHCKLLKSRPAEFGRAAKSPTSPGKPHK